MDKNGCTPAPILQRKKIKPFVSTSNFGEKAGKVVSRGRDAVSDLRGEWPSGLNSLRQVTEVKLGRVRSDFGWVTTEA